MKTVTAMSNKQDRKTKFHKRRQGGPGYASKPLRPFMDVMGVGGQTYEKKGARDAYFSGMSGSGVLAGKVTLSPKMKQAQHLLQQYKDKRKSKDHRKKGPK